MTWDDGIEDELDREYIQGLKRRAEVAERERDAARRDLARQAECLRDMREHYAEDKGIAGVLAALAWDVEHYDEIAEHDRQQVAALVTGLTRARDAWRRRCQERHDEMSRATGVEYSWDYGWHAGPWPAIVQEVKGLVAERLEYAERIGDACKERDAAQARVAEVEAAREISAVERAGLNEWIQAGAGDEDLLDDSEGTYTALLRRAGEVLDDACVDRCPLCACFLDEHHTADCPLAAVRGEIGEVLR